MIPPSVLPPLLARWIGALLPEGVPEEKRSTCMHCPLIEGDDPVFAPSTKCCTYTPDLPSYAVGGVLTDKGPETRWARDVLTARIAGRTGVTPLGIRRLAESQKLYDDLVGRGGVGFGRTPELRCPYYLNVDGGLCGVWRHREAICSTWFCKYERGLTSKAFWRAMQGLIRLIEQSLSGWIVKELDPGGRARELVIFLELADGGRDELLGEVDDEAYAALWGRWHGRQAEYYAQAARLVEPLEWPDIERLGGGQLIMVAAAVRDLHARLVSTELPARVRVAPRAKETRRSKQLVITPTPLSYDPLELPAEVLAVLDRFDDQDPRAVIEALRAEGHPIGAEGVRMLLDYGVLLDASPGAERYIGSYST